MVRPMRKLAFSLVIIPLLWGCSADDAQTGQQTEKAASIDDGKGLKIELHEPQFEKKAPVPEPEKRKQPVTPLDF